MATVIENFPDISFIDNAQVEEVLNQMIADYSEKYKEITGAEATLGQADPIRLVMYACTMQIYQAMQYADHAGKMSFLKYSDGSFLDNLAALHGVIRLEETPAVTTLKFSIEDALQSVVAIPQGTRVTNGNDIYFSTDEYAEISAGQTNVTVKATCTASGRGGNGFAPGEVNILVETIPYITEVTNTTTTEGGSERESDEALRERIFVSPGSYSTAGPATAYEYYVRQADASITDVSVDSLEPGEVNITFTCNGNEVPSQALMDKVEAFLENNEVRPLTDHVVIEAPTTQTYNVSLTYYISRSDSNSVSTIQSAVAAAVSSYNMWQTEKLGRDINPSYLIQKVMEAGAKRVEITLPTRVVLDSTTLAVLGTSNVVYGGLEDD